MGLDADAAGDKDDVTEGLVLEQRVEVVVLLGWRGTELGGWQKGSKGTVSHLFLVVVVKQSVNFSEFFLDCLKVMLFTLVLRHGCGD